MTITYERNGLEYEAEITPREYRTPVSGFGYNTYSEKTSGFNVLKYGAVEVKYMIRTTILSLKELVTGHLGMKDLAARLVLWMPSVILTTVQERRNTDDLDDMLNMAVLLSGQPGSDEPASSSGTGWGKAGISGGRSSSEKTGKSPGRRHDPLRD